MYRKEHKNYMFKKMLKVNGNKLKKLKLSFKEMLTIRTVNERHAPARLSNAMQILAQSLFIFIFLSVGNKKESLGNS